MLVDIRDQLALARANLDGAKVWPALQVLERIMSETPEIGAEWGEIANLYRLAGDVDTATEAARHYLENSPDDPERRGLLAELLGETGHLSEGLEMAIAVAHELPRSPQVRYGIGVMFSRIGEFEKARTCFVDAIELLPSYMAAWEQLAVVHSFASGDPWVQRFQEAESHIEVLKETEKPPLHYGLGKMYADLGDHDRAFAHYEQGARLIRDQYPYDADAHTAYVDRLITYFDAERLTKDGGQGYESEQPIFIVGVPRSGTTLLERILAAHSGVEGGGELPWLKLSLSRLGGFAAGDFREEGPDITSETPWQDVGRDYIKRLAGRFGWEQRITDKTLSHYLYVGWLALAMPEAKIIYCRRDPLDTAWSCFSTYFGGGNRYSYDFADIATYQANYAKLMAHWQQIRPDAIHTVAYESLVADPEPAVRGLLDFCGLPFEEDCLSHEQSGDAVATASLVQVRQPISTSSVGRSAPYHGHMAPWIDELNSTSDI